tara:strand:+ start:70 stop:564 length:495 start_codon:yes stop_codon:yes gene_type:complete
MSKWSKEDRHHYKKSEVMQELEKIVLDRLASLQILSDKLNKKADKIDDATQKFEKLKDAAGQAGEAVKEIDNAMTNSAQDNEANNMIIDTSEDVVVSMNEDSKDGLPEDILTMQQRDSEEDLARLATLRDLNAMLKVAHTNNDLSSVYKIERTIQEILDLENES